MSDLGQHNTFGTRDRLTVGGTDYTIYRLATLEQGGYSVLGRLPFSLRVLLENLLRCEDGLNVTREDIEALLHWSPERPPTREIAFMPARVLMQDFTGVPAVVDLAAMRDAIAELGGNPAAHQPAAAGGAGHRPLRAGRRVRPGRCVPVQRAEGDGAQP